MARNYKTAKLQKQMTAWRHDFHAHPELGFDEHRTASQIALILRDIDLEVHTGIGQTGVVAILQKGNGTGSIGLRADIDALPFDEANSFTHKSKKPNVMHACGHDGHTAMLLGAAKYLTEQGDFNGRVVFIFQPNEEHGLGALAMIQDKLFERFDVDQVFGMHNIPGMEVGTFATRAGPMTASENLFEISIKGVGGHAALPHMGVDAITVGSQVVNALQTIVSRKLDPGLNGVVSVTEFITDGKRNVLPGNATLRGDARGLTPEITKRIEDTMRQIVKGVCQSHGIQADFSFVTEFPPTVNNPQATKVAVEAASHLVGSKKVDGDCPPKLFSEDFAHMAEARPGCYILTGNGTTGSHARPLHSADYDFNDDILTIGSSYWVTLVEQELREDSQ